MRQEHVPGTATPAALVHSLLGHGDHREHQLSAVGNIRFAKDVYQNEEGYLHVYDTVQV